MYFDTLKVRTESAVLIVKIDAPPMNVMGPELVRDLVSLFQQCEADDAIQVLIFKSADANYFILHVDVTRIKENREPAMKLNGEPSLGLLFHYLSKSRLVTIAQIEGRVRGVGSEFVLACDMRFAALETAIFGQFEPSFWVIPGASGAQHLKRLLGRAQALEVVLSADDYNAELAERYGWVNRTLTASELDKFVKSLAHRIAQFPAAGRAMVKERVNAIALPLVEDIRRDSDLFLQGLGSQEFQNIMQTAIRHGFQTHKGELNLGQLMGDLAITLSTNTNK